MRRRNENLNPPAAARKSTATALEIAQTGGNRFCIAVAMLPVLIAAVLCLTALAHRGAQAARSEKPFGQMSQAEAEHFAGDAILRLTGGGSVQVTDTTPLSASSVLRSTRLREWHVTCVAPTGQYLLRINADTRRIFSVNRVVRTPSLMLLPNLDARALMMSRQEAKSRALSYLRQSGATKIGEMTVSLAPVQSLTGVETMWVFTEVRNVPGIGKRTIKVVVNAASGALESLWNPHNTL